MHALAYDFMQMPCPPLWDVIIFHPMSMKHEAADATLNVFGSAQIKLQIYGWARSNLNAELRFVQTTSVRDRLDKGNFLLQQGFDIVSCVSSHTVRSLNRGSEV